MEKLNKGTTGSRKKPVIRVEDDVMFFALRLAKTGYYDGDVDRIMKVPVGIFAAMLEYEAFEADYEAEYIAINQPEDA